MLQYSSSTLLETPCPASSHLSPAWVASSTVSASQQRLKAEPPTHQSLYAGKIIHNTYSSNTTSMNKKDASPHKDSATSYKQISRQRLRTKQLSWGGGAGYNARSLVPTTITALTFYKIQKPVEQEGLGNGHVTHSPGSLVPATIHRLCTKYKNLNESTDWELDALLTGPAEQVLSLDVVERLVRTEAGRDVLLNLSPPLISFQKKATTTTRHLPRSLKVPNDDRREKGEMRQTRQANNLKVPGYLASKTTLGSS